MKRSTTPPARMTPGAYHIVASIIATLPVDIAMRLTVADHFATEFNKRSQYFDPLHWERVTGGKVAANSARM